MIRKRGMLRKSGFALDRKFSELLGFTPQSLGQSYPQRYPAPLREETHASADPLGAPLSIREAARLIGCSPWTVRQTLIPLGLPVFRSGAGGKLIFYTNQVTRWIAHQQKGGMR
jgi:hypothetical protein